jgi:hypothetical protein
MNRNVTIYDLPIINALMKIKYQVVAWYPFTGNDTDFLDFCNNNDGNSKKTTLILFTNDNFQISSDKNTLKLNGKNLISIPCNIKYLKNRITYREGNEAELIDVVDSNIEKYKNELNKILMGFDDKVKCWDSERIQGMLFMCSYKFADILDESTTDCALVTFPKSNISFIFLPVNNHVLYSYLMNQKIKINFFITQRIKEISHKIDEFTKTEIEDMLSHKNILKEIKLSDKYPILDNSLIWEWRDFAGQSNRPLR